MAGNEIYLSVKEFDVLEYLMKYQGEVLPRERIESHVWGIDYCGLTNVIDVYINRNEEDVCADGNWQKYFKSQPASLTEDEIKEYLSTISGVALGSDAFFPFDDNIERAYRSGVSYIAEPGGSIRDDAVIDCCNKYGIAMAFTGMRLFHH